MRDAVLHAVDSATDRAEYADARWVRTEHESIATRSGRIEEVERSDHAGIGVRVRVGGAWGFAAARGDDRAAAEDALGRALALAEAQPAAPAAGLAPEPAARGDWESPMETDPFAVPVEEKLDALFAADAGMRGAGSRVRVARAHFMAWRTEQVFASTEGALCEQRLVDCGGGIAATAANGGETQVRSYPASFRGDVARAGYEHFAALDLAAYAPRVAEEAVALLSAPECPAGKTTLILDGNQMALQLHESVGHAVELDRILGTEAAYAGTSFLRPTDAGALRYGSDRMWVTADAEVAGGLGTYRWDDEGVSARRTRLVEAGELRGFLTSRETAAAIGVEESSGCMRAAGFARQPLVRMTNVSIEPGDAGSLDDLVADTHEGVLMETNRSWSIDERRLQFQFATEMAWEVRNGRRTRLLRNPSYAGVTPEFWGRLDAVCSEPEWRLWGIVNCGKGEPGQTIRVSHGTAPARFRGVQVGVS
jgi:TldD protein